MTHRTCRLSVRAAHRLAGLGMALGAVAAAGCGTTGPLPPPIRFADIGAKGPPSLPMLIEIRAGERIPVHLTVDGNVLGTAAETEPVVLVARRTFYVLFSGNGMPKLCLTTEASSCDVRKSGSVQLGVNARKDQGPEVSVTLVQQVEEN